MIIFYLKMIIITNDMIILTLKIRILMSLMEFNENNIP